MLIGWLSSLGPQALAGLAGLGTTEQSGHAQLDTRQVTCLGIALKQLLPAL